MNEMLWAGALLRLFLWMVPVILLARVIYPLSSRFDGQSGILHLLSAVTLILLPMMFGAWWYIRMEFSFNVSILISHTVETFGLFLLFWTSAILFGKLIRSSAFSNDRDLRSPWRPSLAAFLTVLVGSVWFVFFDKRSWQANLDLFVYAFSCALLAALFVAMGMVVGAFEEKRGTGRYRLVYLSAALVFVYSILRAYLFANHGATPFVAEIRGMREISAVGAALFLIVAVRPGMGAIIRIAGNSTADLPYRRRKAGTQKRLSAAFGVMILFLGILLIAMLESIYSGEQMIENARLQQQTRVAQTLTTNVDSSLDRLSSILGKMSATTAVRRMSISGMKKIFRKLPAGWAADIISVARLDSSGTVLFAYPNSGGVIGKNLLRRPHIRYFLRKRRMTISAPFESFAGEKVVALVSPVRTPEGRGKTIFTGGVSLLVADSVLAGRVFSNVSMVTSSPVAAINMNGTVITESIGRHGGEAAASYLESVFKGDTSPAAIDAAIGEILRTRKTTVVKVGKPGADGTGLVVALPLRASGIHVGAMVVPIRSSIFSRLYHDALSNQVTVWTFLLIVFIGMTGVMMFVYQGWSGFLEREVKRESELVRETEGRYTQLFDSALIGIFRTDQSAAITSANPALARMLGYESPAEIVGRIIIPPDVIRKYAEPAAGRSVDGEPIELTALDGTPVYVRLSCKARQAGETGDPGYDGFLENVTESHLAGQKIRDSELRYAELFRLSPAGIYVTTEEGKILEINDSFATMFGYESTEELLELPATVLYPDSHPRDRFVRALKEQGRVEYEIFDAKRKDGSTICLLENAELVFDPIYDRDVIRGALMDVTDIMDLQRLVELHRKVAETSSEILAAAFQGGDAGMIIDKSIESIGTNLGLDGVVVLEHAGGEIRQTHRWWSGDPLAEDGAAVDAEGLSESLRNSPDNSVFEGEGEDFKDHPIVRTYGHRSFTISKISTRGSEWGYLLLLASGPGRKWLLPERSFIESASKLISTVVEREFEAMFRSRLEEERDELLFAFEQLAEAVVVSDKKGIIRYVNSTFTRLTGFSREDVIGKGTEVLRSEEHEPAFFRRLWNTIMSGNVFKARFKSRRKDGSIVYLDKTIAPVIDSTGEVVSFVEVSNDISTQISLEEQLAQSQKMESIGLLAGGIAHDFNNILGAILGYASLMKVRLSEGDEFFKYVDTIENSASRAAELTAQLLGFARGGKYDVAPVDMNEVVANTLRIIQSTFDKSIVVETALREGIPCVEADPGQMQQVVMNLCVNARDAMAEKGTLRISTADVLVTEKETARKADANPGRYVLLSVSDTGAGIDPSVLRRIFEPFFTTKEKGKGTGLGLSMVYGIVRNHGGFIDVDSEPGEGTTFKIYYPASGKPQNERREKNPMSAIEGGTETVLVAEDEQAMRQLVNDILESGGYRVIAVEDGQSAVDIYSSRKDEIDLVILDMIMPRLNGGETFKKLKAINPSVRVLLSSGYSQDEQARRLLSEGVAGFLGKPYQVAELLEKVRKVLEGK